MAKFWQPSAVSNQHRARDCSIHLSENRKRNETFAARDLFTMSLLHPAKERADGRKVRYAVVGAGWIAQEDFMPGVAKSGNSVMTALVTGDATKGRELREK